MRFPRSVSIFLAWCTCASTLSGTPAYAGDDVESLKRLIGTDRQVELLRLPQVQRSLASVAGSDYKRLMSILSTQGTRINLVNGHLQFSGYVPDLPDVQSAVVCLSTSDFVAHVLLIDGNTRTLYSKTRTYAHLPFCIRQAVVVDLHQHELDAPPVQGESEYRLEFK